MFDDGTFKGYITGQRIGLSKQNTVKLNGYFSLTKQNGTLFDHENVYGIVGLGRSDKDLKHQENTVEEMVSAYSLNTKSALMYFGLEGKLMFGMSPEYKSFQMIEFPIVDTTLHTVDTTRVDIIDYQSNKSTKILDDIRFQLNCNQLLSTVSGEVLKLLINQLNETLSQSSFKNDIVEITDTVLKVKTSDIDRLQRICKIDITTSEGGILHLEEVFVTLDDLDCGKVPCVYRFMFDKGEGPVFTLGNGFLHHRVVEFRPDTFLISKTTVNSTEVASLTYREISTGPQLAYFCLMFTLSLVVLYKSCEGCAITLNNIR